jgi:hypothetical protein
LFSVAIGEVEDKTECGMRRRRAQAPIQEQHSRRRKKNEQVQQRRRMNMYNKEEGRKSSNV